MNYGSYGGGGYGGGGGGGDYGFDGGAAGGGGEEASPARKAEYGDASTLIPVTCHQLLKAAADHPDNNFQIDGRPINKVKVIGCVTRVEDTTTYYGMTLEDGTGSVSVKAWGNDRVESNLIREGMYVSVIGLWKNFREGRNVLAKSIVPITDDFNAVTCHFLECIHAHLLATKGTTPGTHSAAAAYGGGAASTVMPMASTSAGTSYGASAPGFSAYGSGFTPLQQAALDALKKLKERFEEGVPFDVMCSALAQHSPHDVRAALTKLADEAIVYTTHDEDHFLCTL